MIPSIVMKFLAAYSNYGHAARRFAHVSVLLGLAIAGLRHFHVIHAAFVAATESQAGLISYALLSFCALLNASFGMLEIRRSLLRNSCAPGTLQIFSLGLVCLLCAPIIAATSLVDHSALQEQALWHDALPIGRSVVGTDRLALDPHFVIDQRLDLLNPFGLNDTGWTVVANQTPVTIVPTIGYRLQVAGLRTVFIPIWTGDFLVYPDGRIEHLDTSQAQHDARLRSVPIYPRALAVRMLRGLEESDPRFKTSTQVPRSETVAPSLVRDAYSDYWVLPLPVSKYEPSNSFVVDAHTGHVAIQNGSVLASE